jgi:hypothetical protein
MAGSTTLPETRPSQAFPTIGPMILPENGLRRIALGTAALLSRWRKRT